MAEEIPKKKSTHAERVGRKYVGRRLPQSKEDALDWLGYETANVAKEAQLRIQDATDFVTEYARGSMSEEDFQERQGRYFATWGDVLRGAVPDSRGMSDQAIYEAMTDEGKGRGR